MGTNCNPLLPEYFLYSYAAVFIHGIFKKNENKLVRTFKFTFHYIDEVLSLTNSKLK